jgi:chromosome segregation ATPase
MCVGSPSICAWLSQPFPMSRSHSTDRSAPIRRGATVQSYGPLTRPQPMKDDEPRVVLPRPAIRRATNTAHTRADAASAAHTAAASSDDAASASVSGGAFSAFPALDRFLSEKGKNLRERRQQQLQIEAAEEVMLSQPHPPLHIDTLYAPARIGGYPAAASAYPYPHPLPHPAYVPQLAIAHPLPAAVPAVNLAPTIPIEAVDPEPLSPASLEEMLLIPEVQTHLRELKRQWRKEIEHELRFQQPPRPAKRPNDENGSEDETNQGEHKSSGPRVHFSDAHTTTDSPSIETDNQQHAAELQHLRDQLVEEQQAHSTTMSRLTQLTSSRMDEQRINAAEQQQQTHEMDELRASLHTAEMKAQSAQQALEDERQRHQMQLSSLQSSDSLVTSLTTKYESLLEKYTSEKLAAAEMTAMHRIEHMQLERLEQQLQDAQQKLLEARSQLSAEEEKLLSAERSHRQAAHAWAQKEEQLLFSRQDTFGKIESENERLRMQIAHMQTESRQQTDQIQQLQEKLTEVQTKLQEQTRHVEERLEQEERQKHEQMRFTEQVQANLDLLSRESESKQQTVASVEAELRTVLQAMEQMKSKYSNKLIQLQQELDVRTSEVDDCKVLLKTMMAEEKQCRAQRNDAKQQLQRIQEQLQQAQATTTRFQHENTQLQSRPHVDASLTRAQSLEHELRISVEIQTRLEREKEQLALRVDELEEQARSAARHNADERIAHEQALAAAASTVPPEPNPELLAQFHQVSDDLAIKVKLLEHLQEQHSNELRTNAALSAEVRSLKKSVSELERSVSEKEQARRSAANELQELQMESQQWMQWEMDRDELTKELEHLHGENEKLQKQLSKKQESLSYIDKEVENMKCMFEEKEKEIKHKYEKEIDELKQSNNRLRDELQQVRIELTERTHQYQDALNSSHRNEQELRMLIMELEQQKKHKQQLKLQIQAMLPEL